MPLKVVEEGIQEHLDGVGGGGRGAKSTWRNGTTR